jgi:hypothetical protein
MVADQRQDNAEAQTLQLGWGGSDTKVESFASADGERADGALHVPLT